MNKVRITITPCLSLDYQIILKWLELVRHGVGFGNERFGFELL